MAAPDLHIVYGPNETGKSTALGGFLDLLFGIEPAESIQLPARLRSYADRVRPRDKRADASVSTGS